MDAQLRRTGLAMRLVQDNGMAAGASEPQQHLIKLLSLARTWWEELAEGKVRAAELASREQVTKSYVSRVVRLNFLAPRIVEAILAGGQPDALNAKTLLGLHDLPLSWSEQKRRLHLH